jgi:hypothetical protein
MCTHALAMAFSARPNSVIYFVTKMEKLQTS